MPMLPSPIAAVVYAGVKVVGYAAFAHGYQSITGKMESVYAFGAAKTALGLVGGIVYLFALAPIVWGDSPSGVALFIGAIPIRLIVWAGILGLFYGYRPDSRITYIAVLLGTAYSYLLDGVMWIVYQIVPGMVVPWC